MKKLLGLILILMVMIPLASAYPQIEVDETQASYAAFGYLMLGLLKATSNYTLETPNVNISVSEYDVNGANLMIIGYAFNTSIKMDYYIQKPGFDHFIKICEITFTENGWSIWWVEGDLQGNIWRSKFYTSVNNQGERKP